MKKKPKVPVVSPSPYGFEETARRILKPPPMPKKGAKKRRRPSSQK